METSTLFARVLAAGRADPAHPLPARHRGERRPGREIACVLERGGEVGETSGSGHCERVVRVRRPRCPRSRRGPRRAWAPGRSLAPVGLDDGVTLLTPSTACTATCPQEGGCAARLLGQRQNQPLVDRPHPAVPVTTTGVFGAISDLRGRVGGGDHAGEALEPVVGLVVGVVGGVVLRTSGCSPSTRG